MTDLLTINEDDRRKLTSFPEGKLLEIKEDCIVGGHYHKIKTEYFVLISGSARLIVNKDKQGILDLAVGELVLIPPLTYHEFHIKKGSVLIGLCSHPFDHEDDYKI